MFGFRKNNSNYLSFIMGEGNKEKGKSRDFSTLPEEMNRYVNVSKVAEEEKEKPKMAEENSQSGKDYIRNVAKEVLEHFEKEKKPIAQSLGAAARKDNRISHKISPLEEKKNSSKKSTSLEMIKKIEEVRKTIGAIYNKYNKNGELQRRLKIDPENFMDEVIKKAIIQKDENKKESVSTKEIIKKIKEGEKEKGENYKIEDDLLDKLELEISMVADSVANKKVERLNKKEKKDVEKNQPEKSENAEAEPTAEENGMFVVEAPKMFNEQRQEFINNKLKEAENYIIQRNFSSDKEKREFIEKIKYNAGEAFDSWAINIKAGLTEDDIEFLRRAEDPYNYMCMSNEEKKRLYDLQDKINKAKEEIEKEKADLNIEKNDGNKESGDNGKKQIIPEFATKVAKKSLHIEDEPPTKTESAILEQPEEIEREEFVRKELAKAREFIEKQQFSSKAEREDFIDNIIAQANESFDSQKKEKPAEPETKDISDAQEKKLLDALDNARNDFAGTEFREKTALQRIRQYFDRFSKEKKYEENPNIKSCRENYENTLKEYKDYQIEKLKNANLEEKELKTEIKKLFSFFNLSEGLKYYEARVQAKMDYLAESENKIPGEIIWNHMRLKLMHISKWYNEKVPASVKLALAATSFVPGVAAFTLGRRTWGAFMMVAAGGMQMDRLAQFKDRSMNKVKSEALYEEITKNPEGKVDFEKLNGILDGKINNIDDKLNSKNLRSGVNKFLTFAGALFLGGSAIKGIMDLVEHSQTAGVAASKVAERIGAVKHIENVEHIDGTVGKGSNFWKAINTELGKAGLEADHAEATKLAWRDGVAEYAKNNSISFDEAAERLSNIKPGTGFSMTHDTNGWHAHFEDKNTEFAEDAGSSGEKLAVDVDKVDISKEGIDNIHPAAAENMGDNVQSAAADNVGNIAPENPELNKVVQQDITNEMKSYSHELQSQIKNYEEQSAFKTADEIIDKDRMENPGIYELFKEKSLLDISDSGTKEIVSATKDNIFGKSAKTFLSLKDENLAEIMKSEETREAFLSKMPKAGKNFFNELVKQVPPKQGDTVLKWLVRVAVEVKKTKG